MSKQNGEQIAGASDSRLTAPYEAVLMRALDKLTSQIFIFLLAYTMLLIGLAAYGAEMAAWLRNLLYIIPVLGVSTYVLLRQRTLARKAAAHGVQVRAGIVRDSGYVAGIRGIAREFLDNVRVGVGGSTVRLSQTPRERGLSLAQSAPHGKRMPQTPNTDSSLSLHRLPPLRDEGSEQPHLA
jgi:hypothetical protein